VWLTYYTKTCPTQIRHHIFFPNENCPNYVCPNEALTSSTMAQIFCDFLFFATWSSGWFMLG
jgi:hypothetical protein